MNTIEKSYFLQGYIYRLAQEAKEKGLFQHLTIEQIMKIYIDEFENKG